MSGVADHFADERRPRARDRARRSSATLNRAQAAAARRRARREEPLYDPRGALRRHPADTAQALRRARGDRAHRRRHRASTSSRRATARRWSRGFARICTAIPVGIVANNGILFSESALKGAHFIELCAPARHPAASSCRTSPASWSGRKYENGGIAKDGAKMVHRRGHARRCRSSPCSSAAASAPATTACAAAPTQPRFLWMWPNARISVMGGEQAAERAGARSSATASRRQGRRWSGRGGGRVQGADPRAVRDARAIPTTPRARLWDDGVIDPARHAARARARTLRRAQRADRGDALRRVPDVSVTGPDRRRTSRRPMRSDAAIGDRTAESTPASASSR
ncbi:MAG: hypothetical protein MZW92_04965 [Comamonadaceae bacterium]|nr:hypothetical protein [Comamonadaceae bacterium]